LHGAICKVVSAGIPVVVAAGNAGKDAATTVPATYDEVIAVSAFADFDGVPGGLGASTCGSGDRDDRFANFSNFGADVDIAAPGVCIRSTARGSGYAELSGTSMATPHVTGAVALYLAESPDATPGDVRTWLLGTASRSQNSAQGFSDDRDTNREPVLYLGAT
jgi:subtilisin family serine protease